MPPNTLPYFPLQKMKFHFDISSLSDMLVYHKTNLQVTDIYLNHISLISLELLLIRSPHSGIHRVATKVNYNNKIIIKISLLYAKFLAQANYQDSLYRQLTNQGSSSNEVPKLKKFIEETSFHVFCKTWIFLL